MLIVTGLLSRDVTEPLMQKSMGLSMTQIDEDIEHSIVKQGGRTPGTTSKHMGVGSHSTLTFSSSAHRDGDKKFWSNS